MRGLKAVLGLVFVGLLAGCAVPSEVPPPVETRPPPKEIQSADHRAARMLETRWRQQGWAPEIIVRESTDAEGNRLLALQSLTLLLNEPLDTQQSAVEAIAFMAARGEAPMVLIVSLKTAPQQQQVSQWIKQAAVASGGRNAVRLDTRRAPGNPLQITLQYQP